MKKKIIRRPAKAQKVISCIGTRIVRYSFALIVALVTLCSCESGESYGEYAARYAEWQRPNLPYESDYGGRKCEDKCTWSVSYTRAAQNAPDSLAAVCVAVLDMCERDGILDARGIEAYHRMSTVGEYAELIGECEQEECFNDVIAGTDAYEHYLELVGDNAD